MADTTLTYKKLFCIDNHESLFTTSICKSANDSVYNTTSSTCIHHSSSNNLSSSESIFYDHSLGLSVLLLFLTM